MAISLSRTRLSTRFYLSGLLISHKPSFSSLLLSSLMETLASPQLAYLESFVHPLSPVLGPPPVVEEVSSDPSRRSKRSRNERDGHERLALLSPMTVLAADLSANFSVGERCFCLFGF